MGIAVSAGKRRRSPRSRHFFEELEARLLLSASPTVNGNGVVDEGALYTLSLTANSNKTVSGWLVNWGDGTTPQSLSGNWYSVPHTYADGTANYTIQASVTDPDG